MSRDFEYNNNQSAGDWTLETGYTKPVTHAYPRRVFSRRTLSALTVFLQQNKSDINYICAGVEQGFTVMLHTPSEVPSMSNGFFTVSHAKDVTVKVKPKITVTEDSLKDYEPKRRTCYYDNERSLKFSKFYTQNNCRLECLADFTLKQCDCVKFSMLRDAETRVCNRSQINCMNQAEKQIDKEEFLKSFDSRSKVATQCDCLPLCTSIAYDHELAESSYENGKYFKAVGSNSKDHEDLACSVLTVHFKEEEFFTLTRSEFFGFADFLANVGGLLGE